MENTTENSREYQQKAPELASEKVFCDAMKKVLGLSEINVYDDFFEIGGDIETSIEFLAECAKSGYIITLNDIFSQRSPWRLTEKFEGSDATVEQLLENEVNARVKRWSLLAGQNRIITYTKANPESTFYEIKEIFPLKKDIDPEKLKNTVNHVMEAHPAFKTRIFKDDWNRAWNIYDENIYRPVEIKDISEEEFSGLKADSSPMEIYESPLYDINILNVGGSYYLYLHIHKLICDDISLSLLKNQIYHCYMDEGYEIPTDYYISFLKRNYLEVFSEIFPAAGWHYSVMKVEGKVLNTDSKDESHGFEYETHPISKENIYTYTAAAGLATARLNNAPSQQLYTAFNGRDEYYKNFSVGMFSTIIPIYVWDDENSAEDKIKNVKTHINFGVSHVVYDNGGDIYLASGKAIVVNLKTVSKEDALFLELLEGEGEIIKNLRDKKDNVTLDIVFDENSGETSVTYGYPTALYTSEVINKFHDEFSQRVKDFN